MLKRSILIINIVALLLTVIGCSFEMTAPETIVAKKYNFSGYLNVECQGWEETTVDGISPLEYILFRTTEGALAEGEERFLKLNISSYTTFRYLAGTVGSGKITVFKPDTDTSIEKEIESSSLSINDLSAYTKIEYTAISDDLHSLKLVFSGDVANGSAAYVAIPRNIIKYTELSSDSATSYAGVLGEWQKSDIGLDASKFDIFTASSTTTMYLKIKGYDSFRFYITSNSEKGIVTAYEVDKTSVVKQTNGSLYNYQKLSDYSCVKYEGLEKKDHIIRIDFSGTDSSLGYLVIPKVQGDTVLYNNDGFYISAYLNDNWNLTDSIEGLSVDGYMLTPSSNPYNREITDFSIKIKGYPVFNLYAGVTSSGSGNIIVYDTDGSRVKSELVFDESDSANNLKKISFKDLDVSRDYTIRIELKGCTDSASLPYIVIPRNQEVKRIINKDGLVLGVYSLNGWSQTQTEIVNTAGSCVFGTTNDGLPLTNKEMYFFVSGTKVFDFYIASDDVTVCHAEVDGNEYSTDSGKKHIVLNELDPLKTYTVRVYGTEKNGSKSGTCYLILPSSYDYINETVLGGGKVSTRTTDSWAAAELDIAPSEKYLVFSTDGNTEKNKDQTLFLKVEGLSDFSFYYVTSSDYSSVNSKTTVFEIDGFTEKSSSKCVSYLNNLKQANKVEFSGMNPQSEYLVTIRFEETYYSNRSKSYVIIPKMQNNISLLYDSGRSISAKMEAGWTVVGTDNDKPDTSITIPDPGRFVFLASDNTDDSVLTLKVSGYSEFYYYLAQDAGNNHLLQDSISGCVTETADLSPGFFDGKSAKMIRYTEMSPEQTYEIKISSKCSNHNLGSDHCCWLIIPKDQSGAVSSAVLCEGKVSLGVNVFWDRPAVNPEFAPAEQYTVIRTVSNATNYTKDESFDINITGVKEFFCYIGASARDVTVKAFVPDSTQNVLTTANGGGSSLSEYRLVHYTDLDPERNYTLHFAAVRNWTGYKSYGYVVIPNNQGFSEIYNQDNHRISVDTKMQWKKNSDSFADDDNLSVYSTYQKSDFEIKVSGYSKFGFYVHGASAFSVFDEHDNPVAYDIPVGGGPVFVNLNELDKGEHVYRISLSNNTSSDKTYIIIPKEQGKEGYKLFLPILEGVKQSSDGFNIYKTGNSRVATGYLIFDGYDDLGLYLAIEESGSIDVRDTSDNSLLYSFDYSDNTSTGVTDYAFVPVLGVSGERHCYKILYQTDYSCGILAVPEEGPEINFDPVELGIRDASLLISSPAGWKMNNTSSDESYHVYRSLQNVSKAYAVLKTKDMNELTMNVQKNVKNGDGLIIKRLGQDSNIFHAGISSYQPDMDDSSSYYPVVVSGLNGDESFILIEYTNASLTDNSYGQIKIPKSQVPDYYLSHKDDNGRLFAVASGKDWNEFTGSGFIDSNINGTSHMMLVSKNNNESVKELDIIVNGYDNFFMNVYSGSAVNKVIVYEPDSENVVKTTVSKDAGEIVFFSGLGGTLHHIKVKYNPSGFGGQGYVAIPKDQDGYVLEGAETTPEGQISLHATTPGWSLDSTDSDNHVFMFTPTSGMPDVRNTIARLHVSDFDNLWFSLKPTSSACVLKYWTVGSDKQEVNFVNSSHNESGALNFEVFGLEGQDEDVYIEWIASDKNSLTGDALIFIPKIQELPFSEAISDGDGKSYAIASPGDDWDADGTPFDGFLSYSSDSQSTLAGYSQTMYIKVSGYDTFRFLVKSEGNGYVRTFEPDSSASVYWNSSNESSYSNNSSDINGYRLLEYSNLGGGDRLIRVDYVCNRVSENSRGHILIPQQQSNLLPQTEQEGYDVKAYGWDYTSDELFDRYQLHFRTGSTKSVLFLSEEGYDNMWFFVRSSGQNFLKVFDEQTGELITSTEIIGNSLTDNFVNGYQKVVIPGNGSRILRMEYYGAGNSYDARIVIPKSQNAPAEDIVTTGTHVSVTTGYEWEKNQESSSYQFNTVRNRLTGDSVSELKINVSEGDFFRMYVRSSVSGGGHIEVYDTTGAEERLLHTTIDGSGSSDSTAMSYYACVELSGLGASQKEITVRYFRGEDGLESDGEAFVIIPMKQDFSFTDLINDTENTVQIDTSQYGGSWRTISGSYMNRVPAGWYGYQAGNSSGAMIGSSVMYLKLSGYNEYRMYIRASGNPETDYVRVSNSDGSQLYTSADGGVSNSYSINAYKEIRFTGLTGENDYLKVEYIRSADGSGKYGYLIIPSTQSPSSYSDPVLEEGAGQRSVNLGYQWSPYEDSAIDSSDFDVYRSYGNYDTTGVDASMKVKVSGYSDIRLYVRSTGDSTSDYVVVTGPDGSEIARTNVDAGISSRTGLSAYRRVEISGLNNSEKEYTITYHKGEEGSRYSDDYGYLAIPKRQIQRYENKEHDGLSYQVYLNDAWKDNDGLYVSTNSKGVPNSVARMRVRFKDDATYKLIVSVYGGNSSDYVEVKDAFDNSTIGTTLNIAGNYKYITVNNTSELEKEYIIEYHNVSGNGEGRMEFLSSSLSTSVYLSPISSISNVYGWQVTGSSPLSGYTKYQSINKNIDNSYSIMKVVFNDPGTYDLYILGSGEASYDMVYVSQINPSSYTHLDSYESQSGIPVGQSNSLEKYKKVSLRNVNRGDFVYIGFRKDPNVSSFDDRGYVLVPNVR